MATDGPLAYGRDGGDADADERLRIAGLTGVEATLAIAGPGSRSYAFLIDWQIRLLLALAWFAAAWVPGRLAGGPMQRHLLLATLPALLIYFFYQPVMELAMHGRSPGKRMAGVRLVTRTGATPGVGAILIRNVFRLVDCLPSVYLVGLACCFLTRQRVRIGDLAAGTLLVLDAGVAQGTLTPWSPADAVPLPLAELTQELLERWSSLSPTHRRELATKLLARAGQSPEADVPEKHLRERLQQLAARTRAARA